MADYQGNSHKNKEKVVTPDPQEPKNIEKVVEGKVLRRKTPLGKRVKNTFIDGDGHSVKEFVIFDVMVPALKDMIVESFSTGMERMFFGDRRAPSRRGGGSGGRHVINAGRVAYDQMSAHRQAQKSRYTQDDPPRQMSRRGRANHNFDEIVLEDRVDAQEALDRLYGLIEVYDWASVADLYSIVGVTGDFTDDTWGWSDLRGAGITRVRGGGYLLDLPVPEPMNNT